MKGKRGKTWIPHVTLVVMFDRSMGLIFEAFSATMPNTPE
jgi:hypothetical protein